MKSVRSVEINLDSVEEGLRLFIDCRAPNSLFDADLEAAENNEARFQMLEGCFYDYTFNNPKFLFVNVGEQIVQPHSRNKHTGTLSPNIFVGTLSLPIIKDGTPDPVFTVDLEVQSIKSGYRDDYRDMLEFITEKCTDLLLQASSPVSHYFEVDYSKDSRTLYQKFAFIKSIIGSDEFAESIHRIVTTPVTKWTKTLEKRDVRQIRRFSNPELKSMLRGGGRTKLPDSHPLREAGLETVAERIVTIRKTDSVDTPENRFVKHALEVFLKFCTDINSVSGNTSKLKGESFELIRLIESQLNHSIFREISRPTTLKLNSPVLQRKEGYREVLRIWLMFDLAAKLIWTGGDDIYSGGKKDVATLYEYWLFFKLLDLFRTIFEIEPKDVSELIKETSDGLNLQIKQGKFTALRGIYDEGSRKLNIRFNYNRSFQGKKDYPQSGSWTTTLRPDYTLSFWPTGINEEEAEKQELIVHVHFDAKYKVSNLSEFLTEKSDNELDSEKQENRKGKYKNADLLKMHAYKDAIRRTGGAYVLYPGLEPLSRRGFHEIIPGLGAFPVRPSKLDSGISELKDFIKDIIEHFVNRASQREKIAYRVFDIYKAPPDVDKELRDPLPEAYNNNRSLLPDETFVLVGFYNSPEQHEWIKNNKLYNFRMGTGNGSLILDKETVSAKYLLLHTLGDKDSGNLWKIVSNGPRVFSKESLLKKGYPQPSQDFYLIVQIEPLEDPEFLSLRWNFMALKNYKAGRASAVPFWASLTELMKNKTT